MSGELFNVGAVARLSFATRTAAGVLRDPGTITFELLSPSKTKTTVSWPGSAEIVRESEGVFYVDVSIAEHGRDPYLWRLRATGADVTDAREGSLPVKRPLF